MASTTESSSTTVATAPVKLPRITISMAFAAVLPTCWSWAESLIQPFVHNADGCFGQLTYVPSLHAVSSFGHQQPQNKTHCYVLYISLAQLLPYYLRAYKKEPISISKAYMIRTCCWFYPVCPRTSIDFLHLPGRGCPDSCHWRRLHHWPRLSTVPSRAGSRVNESRCRTPAVKAVGPKGWRWISRFVYLLFSNLAFHISQLLPCFYYPIRCWRYVRLYVRVEELSQVQIRSIVYTSFAIFSFHVP